MSDYEQQNIAEKKQNAKMKLAIAVMSVLLVVLIAVAVVVFKSVGSKRGSTGKTTESESETETATLAEIVDEITYSEEEISSSVDDSFSDTDIETETTTTRSTTEKTTEKSTETTTKTTTTKSTTETTTTTTKKPSKGEIIDVSYNQSKYANNTFYFHVSGSPHTIVVYDHHGGTYTYYMNDKNAKKNFEIYDLDNGNEMWAIRITLPGGTYSAKAKFNDGTVSDPYYFDVELLSSSGEATTPAR